MRFPLGVVVGDASLTRLGSWLIPGPDDGLVGDVADGHVGEAGLPDATDDRHRSRGATREPDRDGGASGKSKQAKE